MEMPALHQGAPDTTNEHVRADDLRREEALTVEGSGRFAESSDTLLIDELFVQPGNLM